MQLPSLLLAFAAGAAASVLHPRQNATTPAINSALYDGSCFYPTADPNFPADLSEYLGRWYQVAGTPAIFTLGCSCIFAQYGLNADGTVSVHNGCQLLGLNNSITGTASPVPETYGSAGVFQVSFASVPGGGVICPGPNYIVQKYDPNWAIVQAPSWETLFILSREQHPSDADLNAWINEAVELGTDASKIKKISQDKCKYT